MDLNSALHTFHFLRPAWLAALPLLWILTLWLAQRRKNDGNWTKLIEPDLLPDLRLPDENTGSARAPWPWLALAWSLATLALAGPSWEQYPSTAYHTSAAWVLVLDLSPSMAVADLTPNRITRARYAINDLLDAAHGARTGLVVFGSEAYTVSPLTDDIATVRALTSPLSPDILPLAGDNLAPALEQAGQLLRQTGTHKGHIVALSDGFADPSAAFAVAQRLKAQGITLDVVGVGTKNGAPQLKANGSFVQDEQGRTSLSHLDADLLQRVAASGGGRYVDLTLLPSLADDLRIQSDRFTSAKTSVEAQVIHWRDAGVWLLPWLLLVTAVLSRRGWL